MLLLLHVQQLGLPFLLLGGLVLFLALFRCHALFSVIIIGGAKLIGIIGRKLKNIIHQFSHLLGL